ncbi:MAG TPA: hypothetical protein VEM15_17780 [Thermodesulfobacteriota bacterium]|nr:hypothetical protein [Thermodesulfobacteriota bacterium]
MLWGIVEIGFYGKGNETRKKKVAIREEVFGYEITVKSRFDEYSSLVSDFFLGHYHGRRRIIL